MPCHGDSRRLRAQGPAGLQRMLDAVRRRPGQGAAAQRRRLAFRGGGDRRVAAQRDAWASKIYWYTDFAEAQAAAAREGKPILSLRLLGQARYGAELRQQPFFRTTLYPDPRVSKLLRENFILHWSSERPVPVVTVDFGDGRVMKRTVTGNSIHYVLDANGRPLDALPGLYSAKEFVAKLNERAGAGGGEVDAMRVCVNGTRPPRRSCRPVRTPSSGRRASRRRSSPSRVPKQARRPDALAAGRISPVESRRGRSRRPRARQPAADDRAGHA